jgi:hypothetical protein
LVRLPPPGSALTSLTFAYSTGRQIEMPIGSSSSTLCGPTRGSAGPATRGRYKVPAPSVQ